MEGIKNEKDTESASKKAVKGTDDTDVDIEEIMKSRVPLGDEIIDKLEKCSELKSKAFREYIKKVDRKDIPKEAKIANVRAFMGQNLFCEISYFTWGVPESRLKITLDAVALAIDEVNTVDRRSVKNAGEEQKMFG